MAGRDNWLRLTQICPQIFQHLRNVLQALRAILKRGGPECLWITAWAFKRAGLKVRTPRGLRNLLCSLKYLDLLTFQSCLMSRFITYCPQRQVRGADYPCTQQSPTGSQKLFLAVLTSLLNTQLTSDGYGARLAELDYVREKPSQSTGHLCRSPWITFSLRKLLSHLCMLYRGQGDGRVGHLGKESNHFLLTTSLHESISRATRKRTCFPDVKPTSRDVPMNVYKTDERPTLFDPRDPIWLDNMLKRTPHVHGGQSRKDQLGFFF